MDDQLELPTASEGHEGPTEETEEDVYEEEGGLDWSKIPGMKTGVDRPIIPKRGEKDYEPSGGASSTGSNLQKHNLDNARSAMYKALEAERGISTKTLTYGLWFPRTGHAEVVVARGTLFTTLGFSNLRKAARTRTDVKGKGKQLELLPEEALYLVERGSMYCWRVDDPVAETSEDVLDLPQGEPALEDIPGAPMSAQQAFAEMIGSKGGITPEHYQVFAYLKRLGFTILRVHQPDGIPLYPIPLPNTISRAPSGRLPFLRRVAQWMKSCLLWLWRPISTLPARLEWAKPLALSDLYSHRTKLTTASIYQRLKIIPSGFNAPLDVERPSSPSPYTPFYHVYKPSTQFKKSAPPPPDFSVIVVNARKTPLPSLLEMADLFETLPETPLPAPGSKKAKPAFVPKNEKSPNPATPSQTKTVRFNEPPTFLARLLAYIPAWRQSAPAVAVAPPGGSNPFLALKAGKKNFIVAAVDNGSISFIRFNQGCFQDWPMYSVADRPTK